jgi:putative transposase
MSPNQEEAAAKEDRYKVHAGEPGANIMTEFKNGRPILQNPPVALAPSSSSLFPPVTQNCPENVPIVLSARDEIAHYRLIFVKALEIEISKKDQAVLKTVREFLILYNSGCLLRTVYEKLGSISLRTAYRFREVFAKDGIQGLVPEYGKKGTSKITEHEKNLLLTLLLHPNRLKTAYAITLTKNYLKKQRTESPSSERTLRRFADQFKKEHYDLWVLHREGEKALDDKVLPYLERDRNLLEVGEGLVADGHRMNFEVIDPFTGKPCRAAVVFFWDWRSSFPLGWEIMPEENVQCIFTAFRNAVLTLGKMPKWILIDNGKAFKAKVFTSDINLTETEILGMFARLRINIHFASPYNAKSKPVERFFETFGDQFERLMESYIGSSIEDRPAWTKRNEKLARSFHNPRIPTTAEVNDRMFEWREFYVDQPSRGLEGQTPRQIFDTGRGPGVDPAELVHLMMAREIKRITRNGIDLFGCYWYDEALYGLKDRVVIKYSLSDLSQLYCFYKNEFLCTLRPLPKTHPMACESGTPKDLEDVRRRIGQKRSLKKQTVKLYKMLGHKAEALPWKEIVQEIPDVVEIIEKIEAEKPKGKFISPFIDGINHGEEATELTPEVPDEDGIVVHPESGFSNPAGGYFRYDYQRYEWYAKIEKKHPGTLNDKDQKWIRDYEMTEQWKQFYSERPDFPIVKADNKSCVTERPWFGDDEYKEYNWIMRQETMTQEDRDFIREFRNRSSLYKHMTFDDDEDLDKKVVKGADANPTSKNPGHKEKSSQFQFAFEHYDYLMEKGNLNDLERQFIEDYKCGKISPGEWASIYDRKD